MQDPPKKKSKTFHRHSMQDPQESDGLATGWRWAWLTDEQKPRMLDKLAELREFLEVPLKNVPKPIYVHGSSLWGCARGQKPGDIDIIAPEAGGKSTIYVGTTEINVGTEMWEQCRVGASLLIGDTYGPDIRLDYQEGLSHALLVLTADRSKKCARGVIDEFKEQKYRLEALIYFAQFMSDMSDMDLSAQLKQEMDKMSKNMETAILAMSSSSLQGLVNKDYTRQKIDEQFTRELLGLRDRITLELSKLKG